MRNSSVRPAASPRADARPTRALAERPPERTERLVEAILPKLAGLFDLGWGDLELVDEESGAVFWHHWEQLPPEEQAAGGGSLVPRFPFASPGAAGRKARFDDAPLAEDLGLVARPPSPEAPISEPERDKPETGSDGAQ